MALRKKKIARRGRQKGGAIFTLSFLISCLVMAVRVGVLAARAARVTAAGIKAVRAAVKVVKAVKVIKNTGRLIKAGRKLVDKVDMADSVGELPENLLMQQKIPKRLSPSKHWAHDIHNKLRKKREVMIRKKMHARRLAARKRVSAIVNERMSE